MKKLLMFILLCVSASCHKHNATQVSTGIIPPDSMVQVLTEVHILQATIQLNYLGKDSAHTARQAFARILQKHHLTATEYTNTTKYYSYHPAMLDSIYEKVLSNLNQAKAELQGGEKH